MQPSPLQRLAALGLTPPEGLPILVCFWRRCGPAAPGRGERTLRAVAARRSGIATPVGADQGCGGSTVDLRIRRTNETQVRRSALRSDLRDFKARVLEATDIVGLVSEYVALRRSGSGYKGLCPFHEERTPSFSVRPDRGTWYCFGRCSRGGNAIDFVMAKEGLEFWPALVLLAERAGLPVPERGRGGQGDEQATPRARLLEMHRIAAAFFRAGLERSREGERARRYVRERGIEPAWAERFGLGYAPRGGRHLLEALGRRGFRPEEIVAAGLASEGSHGLRDRFRGRLVFPIHDVLGRVVGFGARTLDPDGVPKYLNSPETPIFKKRRLIYGLHLAKDGIAKAGEVALVEGYTDVILAHQAGLGWFVATLGTAFGAEHARVLRRFTDRVVAFFDADAAGAAANRRALGELAASVFGGERPFASFRIAHLPPGLDPADAVHRLGPQALEQAVREAKPFVQALVPAEAITWPPERRRELAEPVARILAAFESDLERELQLKELAHRLGLSEALVRQLAARSRRKALRDGARAAQEPEDETNGAAVCGEKVSVPTWERHFLRCVLALGMSIESEVAGALEAELVTDPRVREIARTVSRGRAVAEIEDAVARELASKEAATLDPALDWRQMWTGVIARLERERDRRRAARLGLERPGSEEALRAFQETQRRLKARLQSS
ncbi:MAG: DNA primase [Planctomycetota bacterium]|nr:MAG: DNA primase [Planctomycetota bacterium]